MAGGYATGLDATHLSLCIDLGTLTGLALDSAFVFGTSGDSCGLKFTARESQTSGALTLYFWCTAITGSPTINAELRNGPATSGDLQRPEAGGSELGTPGSDATPTANKWFALTWTNVTLTVGNTYFICLKNTHGTPASNHATIAYRGAYDAHGQGAGAFIPAGSGTPVWWRGFTTTDGISTDPTYSLGMFPGVIKQASGFIYGFPWVTSVVHANNANDRGIRVQFDEDVQISEWLEGLQSSNLDGWEITKVSDNSVVASRAITDWAELNSGAHVFPDVTLSGGEAYNIVRTSSGASTALPTMAYMGEADATLPADVQACRPTWFKGFVGGATSPGSYTLTEGRCMPCLLGLSLNPAIVGGGGVNRAALPSGLSALG